MIYPYEVNVIYMDNHDGVRGSVNRNRDGSYTIIINPKLNYEQQIEVYKHELRHIQNDDFHKFDAQKIESDAHFYTVLNGLNRANAL